MRNSPSAPQALPGAQQLFNSSWRAVYSDTTDVSARRRLSTAQDSDSYQGSLATPHKLQQRSRGQQQQPELWRWKPAVALAGGRSSDAAAANTARHLGIYSDSSDDDEDDGGGAGGVGRHCGSTLGGVSFGAYSLFNPTYISHVGTDGRAYAANKSSATASEMNQSLLVGNSFNNITSELGPGGWRLEDLTHGDDSLDGLGATDGTSLLPGCNGSSSCSKAEDRLTMSTISSLRGAAGIATATTITAAAAFAPLQSNTSDGGWSPLLTYDNPNAISSHGSFADPTAAMGRRNKGKAIHIHSTNDDGDDVQSNYGNNREDTGGYETGMTSAHSLLRLTRGSGVVVVTAAVPRGNTTVVARDRAASEPLPVCPNPLAGKQHSYSLRVTGSSGGRPAAHQPAPPPLLLPRRCPATTTTSHGPPQRGGALPLSAFTVMPINSNSPASLALSQRKAGGSSGLGHRSSSSPGNSASTGSGTGPATTFRRVLVGTASSVDGGDSTISARSGGEAAIRVTHPPPGSARPSDMLLKASPPAVTAAHHTPAAHHTTTAATAAVTAMSPGLAKLRLQLQQQSNQQEQQPQWRRASSLPSATSDDYTAPPGDSLFATRPSNSNSNAKVIDLPTVLPAVRSSRMQRQQKDKGKGKDKDTPSSSSSAVLPTQHPEPLSQDRFTAFGGGSLGRAASGGGGGGNYSSPGLFNAAGSSGQADVPQTASPAPVASILKLTASTTTTSTSTSDENINTGSTGSTVSAFSATSPQEFPSPSLSSPLAATPITHSSSGRSSAVAATRPVPTPPASPPLSAVPYKSHRQRAKRVVSFLAAFDETI